MKIRIPRHDPRRKKLSRSEILQRLKRAAAHLVATASIAGIAYCVYLLISRFFPSLDGLAALVWVGIFVGCAWEAFRIMAILAGQDGGDSPHRR